MEVLCHLVLSLPGSLSGVIFCSHSGCVCYVNDQMSSFPVGSIKHLWCQFCSESFSKVTVCLAGLSVWVSPAFCLIGFPSSLKPDCVPWKLCAQASPLLHPLLPPSKGTSNIERKDTFSLMQKLLKSKHSFSANLLRTPPVSVWNRAIIVPTSQSFVKWVSNCYVNMCYYNYHYGWMVMGWFFFF